MSSIGPQLPPHLAKRKRSSDDEGDVADSPPGKVSARRSTEAAQHNKDEINLDGEASSGDDGYGPSVSISKPIQPSARPSIGPSLPPQAQSSSNKDEIDLDSDSDSDVGPAPPSIGPSLPPTRVIGPALPPADLGERPAQNVESDSDSDDDYGPAPPSAAGSSRGPASVMSAPSTNQTDTAPASKRDDWMLAPPTSSSGRAPDPTKLKARKFASGRAANAPGGGVSSIWTETPEEKRKRLEDAVLGRGTETSTSYQSGKPGPKERTQEDEERDRRINSYTEKTRGKSMYEEHQAAKKASRDSTSGKQRYDGEEEDDPSKRAFDREKDMGLGGKIGTSQRRELLHKAANFGGRFQKGSYL
jgi:hypothetical protein